MKVMFSINDYDKDGDVCEGGVYLHFGDTRVLVAESLRGFQSVIDRIAGMPKEIEENYPEFCKPGEGEDL